MAGRGHGRRKEGELGLFTGSDRPRLTPGAAHGQGLAAGDRTPPVGRRSSRKKERVCRATERIAAAVAFEAIQRWQICNGFVPVQVPEIVILSDEEDCVVTGVVPACEKAEVRVVRGGVGIVRFSRKSFSEYQKNSRCLQETVVTARKTRRGKRAKVETVVAEEVKVETEEEVKPLVIDLAVDEETVSTTTDGVPLQFAALGVSERRTFVLHRTNAGYEVDANLFAVSAIITQWRAFKQTCKRC